MSAASLPVALQTPEGVRDYRAHQLACALAYAHDGISVLQVYFPAFPGCTCPKGINCDKPGKHPRSPNGLHDATTDEATIRSWFNGGDLFNIAGRMGSDAMLVAVDVDPRHGGHQGLADLQQEIGTLPPTRTARTGGADDGRHLFFEHPGDRQLGNRVNFRPGLDVRGDGGYVVLAPSLHESGRFYDWLDWNTPPAPLPAALLQIIERPNSKAATPNTTTPGCIPSGQRSNALTSMGGAMHARAMGHAAINAALLITNTELCKPPLSDSEVRSIAASIVRNYPAGNLPTQVHTVPEDRFRTAADIAHETPSVTEWLIQPWVALKSITELLGAPKNGKTTWMFGMIAAALDGRPFMGFPTVKTPVVYLTEERSATLRQALDRAGLLNRKDLIILHWHQVTDIPWRGIVESAVKACHRQGARLLVVDTLAQWARMKGDGENAAGEALHVVEPLMHAAAAGLGVVAVRHERKSGGDVSSAGRGSNAFTAAADVVLSLRRCEGQGPETQRIIHGASRFSETPSELVIELTANGFVALGNRTDAANALSRAILSTLSSNQVLRIEDLMAATGRAQSTVQDAVNVLLHSGLLVRVQLAGRGAPFGYHLQQQPSASNGAASP